MNIKTKILERELNPNEKLPSKRDLANQLKVSINTVAKAYEQLLTEGYIYTLERSGYYVDNITQFMKKTKYIKKFPEELKEKKPINKNGWLRLSHMAIDSSLFPFNKWLKYKRQAIDNHKLELGEITHPQGPYVVRKTISQLIWRSRGVVCEPEQIVISTGAQPLIKQLMDIQKDDTIIALENPGYSRFHSLLSRLNLHIKPIELDRAGIDISKIKASNIDFVIVTPSHQFPTGKIMPISRRIDLLNWASEKDNRFIIEDDYDSEYKYKSDEIESLQSLDKYQRVIYLGTFSKSLLPSLRISYMVLPPELLKKYREIYTDLLPYNNTLTLYTLHYFIISGEYTRHIKKTNHHYRIKRNQIIKNLNDRFKNYININDIPAGLHFTATFKTNKSYEEVEKKAEEYKIEIYTIKHFMLKNKNKRKNTIELIIGFANIQKKDIEEAVNRLYNVIMH